MNLLRKIEEFRQILSKIGTSELGKTKEGFAVMHAFSTMRSKVFAWQDQGSKTFRLSKELVEAFQHTDIPHDLYPLDFPYPFETFMIEGESPLFQTKIREKNGVGHIGNIFSILYLDVNALGADARFVSADGMQESESPMWQRSLTGFFPGEEFGVEQLMLHLKDDVTLQQSIDMKQDNIHILPIDEDDARNLVNLLFNAVLYINDPDRSRVDTERSESRKVNIGAKARVNQKYIYLTPPRNYKALPSSGPGTPLDTRFIVRGHWRHQAYGAGHALRRLKWITPYWKGPELAEIAQKIYKVS